VSRPTLTWSWSVAVGPCGVPGVTSPHESALPLIITHGWPGSIIEMLGVIGPLTDPASHGRSAEDAFDIVLPSLPGYGFSPEPTELGWAVGRIAQAWAELMRRLGYARYAAQGGDVGAAVTDSMGRQAPEGLAGIHLNLLLAGLGGGYPSPDPTAEERAALEAVTPFRTSGNGYLIEQNTRPQTIGYALLDAPSLWRPGCSTTTPTPTTRSPVPSSAGSPPAASPATTSSTTSRCTG
jgi:pimeloyl-ACP methyl ester carboxylesterase